MRSSRQTQSRSPRRALPVAGTGNGHPLRPRVGVRVHGLVPGPASRRIMVDLPVPDIPVSSTRSRPQRKHPPPPPCDIAPSPSRRAAPGPAPRGIALRCAGTAAAVLAAPKCSLCAGASCRRLRPAAATPRPLTGTARSGSEDYAAHPVRAGPDASCGPIQEPEPWPLPRSPPGVDARDAFPSPLATAPSGPPRTSRRPHRAAAPLLALKCARRRHAASTVRITLIGRPRRRRAGPIAPRHGAGDRRVR